MSANEAWRVEPEKQDDPIVHEPIQHLGWKSLFGFTNRKHLPFLGGAVFFGIVAGLALPAEAILYGLVFNQFANFGSGAITGPKLLENVSKYCAYMTAIAAVDWFANSIFFVFWLTFGELQARSARNHIFNSLLVKDITWYDTRRSGIGAFLPTIQTHIRDLQLATSQPMGDGLQCIVVCLSCLGIAFYYAWDLTLITICTVPIVYLVMAFLSSRLSRKAHQQGDYLQEALKYLTNAIQHIEMVKCFNGEPFELNKFNRIITRATKIFHSQANIRSIQIGFMQFITFSMFVQGFWYGSSLVSTGKRTPAQVLTTFWAALMAVQGVTGFLPQLVVIQKGKVAGAKLLETMAQIQGHEAAPEIQEGEVPIECSGYIEFKKVSFAYPSLKEKLALREVNISFPGGKTTFVIGKSGSGKSTIGQLLVRLYEPTAGEILLDGLSLRELDIHWLRQNVTLVEQHSILFNDTIYGNIALVKWMIDEISMEDVQNAATFAELDQTINELPDGFQTLVGLGGSSLSGGQRQRVALARAKLRDTPILILDESTSALDYVTRLRVLEALREWRRGKTTIIITHDISQIMSDDLVYILDQSRVIEHGHRWSIEHSASFTGFLATQEDNLSEENDSSEGATDEIWSLYAESWDATSRRNSHMSPSLQSGQEGHSQGLFNASNKGESLAPNIVSPYWRLSQNLEEGSGSSHRPSLAGSSQKVNLADPKKQNHFSRVMRSIPKDRSPHPEGLSREEIENRVASDERLQQPHQRTATAAKKVSTLRILRSVFPNLDFGSRFLLLCGFLCATVHAGATPAFSYVFARLLSTFYVKANQQQLALQYALTILGITLIDGVSTYGFHFLLEYCAQDWVNNIKMRAYGQLLQQPREFFDEDENSVSNLAETLDHFSEEARNILGRFVGIVYVLLCMLGVTVVWSLISCWKLTLVTIAVTPIMYAITAGYKAIINKWESHSNDADETIGTVLRETFFNIRTVRCLVLEEVFRRRFVQATRSALKIGMKRAIYGGSFFGLNYSMVYFLSAFLFWYGATIVASGDFTISEFIQAAMLLLMSASYANFVVTLVPQIGSSKDGAARLLRLSNLRKDSHESSGWIELAAVGDISLQHVNFAYSSRKDHSVLCDVGFHIAKGSCVAIVGASGSGKSTIASLLLKLYPTTVHQSSDRPDITISGQDIKRLHTRALRSHMAIVSQAPVLFPGTIMENITYGLSPSSPYTTPDNIQAAAKAAGIEDFINGLPSGYQTVIGEGGIGVSGGQAQRIAIARALARRPDVLILDEATSALDVESAGVVRDTIHRLVLGTRGSSEGDKEVESDFAAPGMTVIIITHAREMMAIADHIVMLDSGKVVEEGSFDELRRKRGPFARLLRGGDGPNGAGSRMRGGRKGKEKDL